MSATVIRAALDAHDALVRDCAEGRLTVEEFLDAYGDFPRVYASEERDVLRLFRKRVAFHRQVAGVISGLRGSAELRSMKDGKVGDLLPLVGLMRLRALVARYPKFEATGGGNLGAGPAAGDGRAVP